MTHLKHTVLAAGLGLSLAGGRPLGSCARKPSNTR